MAVSILLVVASVAVASGLYALLRWWQNLQAARASGFTCVLLPTHLMSVSWILASPLFLPLLNRLPERVRSQWIPDTIMAVSPFKTTLFTCDPQLTTQLLRNPAFGKPTEMLALLNVFGPSLTGTDGAENKLFRRVAGPFFHARTMNAVVRETVAATETFLDRFTTSTAAPLDTQLRPTLAKMALHVLGRAAFEKEGSCRDELAFTETCPEGHELSFADTFLGIDQHLPLVALTPLPILKHSPLSFHKRAYVLHKEMSQYLREAVQRKTSAPRPAKAESKSMLDLLVDAGEQGILSPPQVTGNIFIINFAGHESNAQGVHLALLNLACRPDLQTQVQKDIDRILGDVPPQQWTADRDYTALAESMVGAVINESLRLYTVLPIFVKHTTSAPVTVTLADQKHIVPPNTLIFVNTSATHRNPRYWPTPEKLTHEGAPYAVSAFDPHQWLNGGKDGKFLTPEPGSFVPFSDGGRGCLGQKFAMVELCFTLARMLKDHTVELVTGATNLDGREEQQRKWNAARHNAQFQLSGGVIYNMTLRLSGSVPVRFVPRGQDTVYGDV